MLLMNLFMISLYTHHTQLSMFFPFSATSSQDDLHRRIGGRCSSSNTKVIFKVFGGNDSAKTTTEPPTFYNNNSNNNNDPARLPPRVDWPINGWKNHHNDDASRSGDSTNMENDHFYKPNESFNNNKNQNIGFGFPSTQRPFYINRDNSNVNSNTNGGGSNSINKPTKKTSECHHDPDSCNFFAPFTT